MLVDNWMSLVRIVAVGVPIYFVLVALLRVTGKRALAKMSASRSCWPPSAPAAG